MSFVEVMVSMALLSLLVAGVFATFSLAGKSYGQLGNLDVQGLNFARETLEKLHNSVSTDPARSAPLNAGTDIIDSLPAGSFRDNHAATRTYDVIDVDQGGDGKVDYKKVTVTVKWND